MRIKSTTVKQDVYGKCLIVRTSSIVQGKAK